MNARENHTKTGSCQGEKQYVSWFHLTMSVLIMSKKWESALLCEISDFPWLPAWWGLFVNFSFHRWAWFAFFTRVWKVHNKKWFITWQEPVYMYSNLVRDISLSKNIIKGHYSIEIELTIDFLLNFAYWLFIVKEFKFCNKKEGSPYWFRKHPIFPYNISFRNAIIWIMHAMSCGSRKNREKAKCEITIDIQYRLQGTI